MGPFNLIDSICHKNDGPIVTGVDPITIRRSLIPSSLRPLSSQDEVEWKEERKLECIDSAIGQETQLAVLETTERVLYTVQNVRNILHYDALRKEPESYGSVWKLREAGGIHRPELDGNNGTLWNILETTCIVQVRARLTPTLTHVVTYELVTSGAEDDAMSPIHSYWQQLPRNQMGPINLIGHACHKNNGPIQTHWHYLLKRNGPNQSYWQYLQ